MLHSRLSSAQLPFSPSSFKNLFKLKKDLLVTSSLSTLNQLSCSVSISNLSNDFCSVVRPATHSSLSNVIGAGSLGGFAGFVLEVLGFVVGEPKKDVMLPLALGFLTSAAARSAAFRFRGIEAMIEGLSFLLSDVVNSCLFPSGMLGTIVESTY